MNIRTDPTEPRPITVAEVTSALRAAGLDLRAASNGLVLRRREPATCAIPECGQGAAVSHSGRVYCASHALERTA